MNIKIKKLSEGAIIPTKATSGAAAYDVYTPRDYNIVKGRQVLPLDLSIELPYGYEAKIEPRSGFSVNGVLGYHSKPLDNTTAELHRFDADVISGKVDSDYRGNMGVILYSKETYFLIPAGTRIAQLTIYKTEDAEFIETESLSDTDRGAGGFGHTGAK